MSNPFLGFVHVGAYLCVCERFVVALWIIHSSGQMQTAPHTPCYSFNGACSTVILSWKACNSFFLMGGPL